MLWRLVSEAAHTGEEVLDGLPVPARSRELVPALPAALASLSSTVVPARQAAALAATGFVAGAAATAVVGHRAPRWFGRRRRRRKGMVGEILSTNSFLVDVHLVRRG